MKILCLGKSLIFFHGEVSTLQVIISYQTNQKGLTQPDVDWDSGDRQHQKQAC